MPPQQSPPLCFYLQTPDSFSNKAFALHLQHAQKASTALLSHCSTSEEQERSNDLKDALSGVVGKQVEELLNREENEGLLDGLEKASLKVEMAKRKLAEIERQELEAQLLRNYINQLESRASEIAECQQEISQARAMVEEAERSLSLNEDNVGDEDAFSRADGEGIDIDYNQMPTDRILCAVPHGLGTLVGRPPLELDPESFLPHAVDDFTGKEQEVPCKQESSAKS